MRCNNCGYDNAPGIASCVKCGHSLQSENTGYSDNGYQNIRVPNYGGGNQPRPTVVNAPNAQYTPRPTVMDAQHAAPMPRPTRIGNGPLLQEAAPQQPPLAGYNETQAPQRCLHCGYPVMGNFTSCPNCGADLIQGPSTKADTEQQPAKTNKHAAATSARQLADIELDIDKEVKCTKCGAMVSIDYTFCPTCGERIHLPTIKKPRFKQAPQPHCHLTLIPEEDENVTPVKQKYEGAAITLNRENTEPANRTITSKEQAELSFENGKWYILNKSELQTTYLEANRKLEIQPGDVVVLGDRRFRFETGESEK